MWSTTYSTSSVFSSSVLLLSLLLYNRFIRGYDVIEDGKQGIIRIQLKYGQTGERVISGLKRISKPGMRVMLLIVCRSFNSYSIFFLLYAYSSIKFLS